MCCLFDARLIRVPLLVLDLTRVRPAPRQPSRQGGIVWPLPSTGVTQLLQYYEPLRHPSQLGLSLASCQLIHTAITAGTSRVATGPLRLHAVANTPAGRMEFIRSYDSIRFGLPRNRAGIPPLWTTAFSRRTR